MLKEFCKPGHIIKGGKEQQHPNLENKDGIMKSNVYPGISQSYPKKINEFGVPGSQTEGV